MSVCKLLLEYLLYQIKFENDFTVVEACISSLAKLFRCLNHHFINTEANELDAICDTMRLIMHRDCSFQMGTADLPFEIDDVEDKEESFENYALI